MRKLYFVIGALFLLPAAAAAQSPVPTRDTTAVSTQTTNPAGLKQAGKAQVVGGRLQRALAHPGGSMDSTFARIRAEKRARRDSVEH